MTRTRKNYIYLLVLLPFLVVALLYEIVPLLMIVFNSFMPENAIGFTLEHYVDIFTKPLYQKAIWNSIRISLVSSLIGIFIAFLGAKAANSAGPKMQNAFLTVLNMTSNFAGVPLAFAYMIDPLLGGIQFGAVQSVDGGCRIILRIGHGIGGVVVGIRPQDKRRLVAFFCDILDGGRHLRIDQW